MTLLLLVASAPAPAAETSTTTTDQPTTVTFAQAVSMAVARNPSTAVARAGVEVADAQRRQVRASSLPTLSGGALYSQIDAERIVGGRVAQGQEAVNVNLLLSAPLLSASRWGAWRRAADAVEVASASVKSAERDVALGAGRAYLVVLLARRLVEVARVARDTASQHLDFANQRFRGGVGTRLDVVRAAQEVEAAETQLASAEVQLVRARETLGVVLGVEGAVDAAEEPVFPVEPSSPNGPGGGADNAADARIEARPDVSLAARAAWAAERGTHDAWRDFLPTLSANFQPYYQNPPTLTLPEWGWQAQLSLVLPLYDGGLRYGQAMERAATLTLARARYDQSVRQARAEVRSARAGVSGANVALTRARSSAKLAHEAAELARVAYMAGAATNLELIDADRRARDADTQVSLAEDALRQSQLESLAAAGQFP